MSLCDFKVSITQDYTNVDLQRNKMVCLRKY